ncbi:MAG: type II secretion system F family protein [Candidatus Pacebacteria bacterium]|nr:type II secretion system F family protein [Candidatus Paceibacterota bacterium]
MKWFDSLSSLGFRLSLKDKMLFARHMEMMTRSGMQILDALEILKKQTKSKPFISMVDHLIEDVRNGQNLSVGMQRYKNVFGEFFINLIRVGESSGTLSENFAYLATELGKKSELQKKIRGAMAYPLVILFATFGISGILSFVIFPKILPVLRSLNTTLPLSTRIFISISEFMISNGLLLFGVVIGGIVLATLLLRIGAIRLVWHRIILATPFVNRMSIDVNIISISRTLNLLLRGGVKIVQALEITSDTLTNLVYQNELRVIAQAVQRGEPMSKSMILNERLFPPTFSQMAAVGENTGKLDETLVFLADFYESEMDNSTKSMSNVLEPAMLLAMGGIVMFVAISIITPIYSVTQTLGR